MPKLSPVILESGPATIGVLERNRTVLARATRIVRAAAGLSHIASETDPAGLRAQLSPETRLLVCSDQDFELALDWTRRYFPRARVLVWSSGPMEPLVLAAARDPHVRGILGWPSFLSMPRPWELALAVRRALHQAETMLHLTELFVGAPVTTKYASQTSADRDSICGELVGLAERAGATDRMLGRIGEVSHELLMNAMYDAPVNHYGESRYAHDRRASIALEDHEVPSARFATDGTLVAIQVTDPFGRLTRAHVLASIARGQANSAGDAVIDASNGGAGLGLWKIYSQAAITIVDVIAGHSTSVTAVFDIDIAPREARTMPGSLHLFDRELV